MITTSVEELHAKIRQEREATPNVRARDLADRLGISEGELVCAGLGQTATRLTGPWSEVITAFGDLGEVMALTRNHGVVHEKVGEYANMSFGAHGGIVLNHDIDLRLFLKNWAFGFAVSEDTRSGPRRSLQFFGPDGTAVHKVYLRAESHEAAYEALIAQFVHENQQSLIEVAALPADTPDRADGEIDAEGLLSHWSGLKDTHDFFPLLRKYKVGRQQALRLAEGRFAERAPVDAAERVLHAASASGAPIMAFVGNKGIIQIHTGPVTRIEPKGPWINVLDDGFNLHLRSDLVTDAWVVRKPTDDGDVTSVELYDNDGAMLIQFFGERKPGQVERDDWRTIVSENVLGKGVAA
ncbi:MAG: hemin-degrading factor [Parvibaculaceae bacterium]|nr:hemin-degrading factor [Parvibaculaceae bacterium]HBM87579.1 hemin-degrading factor [Rhodobiaceae bacterium]|tara:strand:- start:20 stop:1078 length:1059 start_codon:yes stop_codon:yes gene_type:complete